MITNIRIIVAILVLSVGFVHSPAASQIRRPASSVGSEYYVPEAWRDRARQLVEPGPDGLPGGLTLKKLELGTRITVTYEGPSGALTVAVIPAKQAPADSLWKGEKLALSLVQSSLSEGMKKESLKKLESLLARRDSGWGWLRRPITASADGLAVAQAHQTLKDLRRRAWTGSSAADLSSPLEQVLSKSPRDISVSLAASRVALRAGDVERSRKVAQTARAQGIRGASSAGISVEMLARVRVALSNASAYAGLVDETQKVTQVILDAGVDVCRLSRTVRAFTEVGALQEAQALTNSILKVGPNCNEVAAQRVEIALQMNDTTRARNLMERAREIHKTSLPVLAAQVRVELAAGQPAQALGPATVLARQGRGRGEGFAMLTAVAAHGVVDKAELERWAGLAARHPTDVGALQMGLVTCFARKDHACALKVLERLEQSGARAPALTAAHARALMQAGRLGEANEKLDRAWEEDTSGLAEVAVEAELRTAEGDSAAAIRLWTAYLKALASDGPGPVTEAQARAHLATLEGGASSSSAEATGSTDAPDGGPAGGGIPVWIWALLGIPVLAIAFQRMRGGDEQRSTSGS